MESLKILILLIMFGWGKSSAQSKKQFADDLSTAVFTTFYVTEEKNDITYVSHDLEDGAWQFFSSDEIANFEKEARLVSLKNIIEIDPSVVEIADMPEGYYAVRKSKKDNWIINKQE